MFVLSFLSFLNQVKILLNVCNEVLFVFEALLMLKYESLNTHDVTSMYNHTSNRIWLKKRLTQSTSLKIKWPEKKFGAPIPVNRLQKTSGYVSEKKNLIQFAQLENEEKLCLEGTSKIWATFN